MTLIEKEDKRVSQAVTNHARCETLGVEIHLRNYNWLAQLNLKIKESTRERLLCVRLSFSIHHLTPLSVFSKCIRQL